MIKLLAKWFIKNSENTADRYVREKYGVLSGVLGIICNLFLFCVKLVIGTLMNSIAITSDAFNNLSDCGSSVVSVISAKMSNMHPDTEHPFGHGRIEYISSLIVSFIIILVGFELLKTSAAKFSHPTDVNFSVPLVCILALSMLVKLWMFSYNRYIGNKIDSSVVKATSADSINDVLSTLVIIISVIAGNFVSFSVDAVMGVIVSCIIMYAGFKIAKETIDVLLGKSPAKELVDAVKAEILSGENIYDIHDLVVHDYGPGRIMASVHAEVPYDADIVSVHETIDRLEKNVLENCGVQLVIHMDPVNTGCEKTNSFKNMVNDIISHIDPVLSIHDFRMTDGENHINLIFDMVVPGSWSNAKRSETVALIKNTIHENDNRCDAVINIDTDFTGEN